MRFSYTVNSQITKRGTDDHPSLFLCPSVLIVVFILQSCFAISQNISKHYTSSLQSKNILYYFHKQKGYTNKKFSSKLDHEIIYLTGSDSALVNFSYYDKRDLKPDSIAFVSAGRSMMHPVKKIFIDPYKEGWVYRYSTRLPYSELISFFQEKKPLILLHDNSGTVPLTMRAKKWRKNSAISTRIFRLISYNQK
jgi:hypothetical protein